VADNFGKINQMSFSTYFRISSYAMMAIATVTLLLAGGLGAGLTLIFALAMVLAWKLEDTKWQFSEKVGLAIVLISIPLFFLDWRYQRALGEAHERLGVNALAHLIVFLSAVKLMQIKSDRDWVFLYLISFFEVLLAAGLSFSPIFLATFVLYVLCAVSTIIAFEIRKARSGMKVVQTRLLVPPDSVVFKRLATGRKGPSPEVGRLPILAFSLLVLILILALPLFLIAPRAGSAMIAASGNGLTNFIGFSETVTLGDIGKLKKSDDVVMHVRIEEGRFNPPREFRWRGVALDEFTGKSWKKSAPVRPPEQPQNEGGFFKLGTTEAIHRLTTQTVFLEPIESPVLFAAPRLVAIQGDLPFVRLDSEDSIQSRRHDLDRLIYRAISDTTEPSLETLRADAQPYSAKFERYWRLPSNVNPRIAELASAMILSAHARNRYDKARAIEALLRSNYGYSLEMKATGPDPLTDFLFNIRSGHCEYFATAMAVMLRSQGIATRVVNGFLPGEYNEAASAYTVRQSDAHSWVEVFFPESNSWLTFDPTPPAGRVTTIRTGLTAKLEKYAEALELIWFQYIVGYDQQEQRSLATSLHNRLFDLRRSVMLILNRIRHSLAFYVYTVCLTITLSAIIGAGILILRRVRRLGWRRGIKVWPINVPQGGSAVVFYERLIKLLEERGLSRKDFQTPLEFATALGSSEAMGITHAYNRVRFGGERLSPRELHQLEIALSNLEMKG